MSGDLDGDGELNSGNAYHVVYYRYPTGAILDGFTITLGYADGPLNDPGRPDGMGGGLYSAGNVTVRNVTFTDNWAKLGGGMWLKFHDFALSNLTFAGNQASEDGGGLYNEGTNAALTNVTFHDNSASGNGGGMFNDGGAPTLRNVTFKDNSAVHGGAMGNASSVPTINDSILWDDTGGEIYNSASSPVFVDSLVGDSGGSASWDSDFGADGGGNVDGDPLLGPLASNPGPTNYTNTMALGNGSAAVDAGGANSTCASTDQRGVTRPDGAACDMGAYEGGLPIIPTATLTATPTITPTVTHIITASAGTGGSISPSGARSR